MKEIKRYGTGLSGQVIETKQGSFVDYDDHAAIVAELQEQVRVLAAEIHFNKLSISRVSAAVSVGRTGHAMSILGGLGETPATDDAIREIRALAVEEFAKHLRAHMQDGSPLWLLAIGADEFAARIRSGEQP